MWILLLPLTLWLLVYYVHTQQRSSNSSTRHDLSHFSMSWYGTATYATSALNQLLYRTAQRHQRIFHYFYLPAIPVALLSLPLSVALLLFNVLRVTYVHVVRPVMAFAYDDSAAASDVSLSSTNLLSVAVPGFTLPLSSIGYLWLAVLCSVVLHEAGHALCACAEGVRIRSVGLTWLVMFPAAYVETEELENDTETQSDTQSSGSDHDDEDEAEDRVPAVSAIQKLKIVSAGVYHNLLLSAATLAILAAMPTLFSLAYHTADRGVTILSVHGGVSPALSTSPVLTVGSRIVGVNQWPVSGVTEWRDVLIHRMQQQQAPTHDGWCVSSAMVEDTAKVQRRQTTKWLTAKRDESWLQLAQRVSSTLQAQRAATAPSAPAPPIEDALTNAAMPASLRRVGAVMEHSDRPLVPANNVDYDSDMLAFACCIVELAPLSPLVCFAHNFSASAASAASLCLQPKGLISAATPTCSAFSACSSSSVEPMTCVSPQLTGNQRLLVLVVETADSSARNEVRFVGRVDEVLGAVEGTGYAMRGWLRFVLIFAPFLWSLTVHWPVLCTRALQFVVAVSTSLLALNALPIPYADGQHFVYLLSTVARDKRQPVGWYHRLLQRGLYAFPVWWWHERQVEWRVRVVTALFIVNVALSVLPIVTSLVTIASL